MSRDSSEESDRGDFRRIAARGTSFIRREGSRFRGLAAPIEVPEDRDEWMRSLRDDYPKARHICHAIRLHGESSDRVTAEYDDAGEPNRTGGFPLLQLLEGRGIRNGFVAVVRHYGGTKLGTGGLARAYRDAGRAAIEDAGTEPGFYTERRYLVLTYEEYGRLEDLLVNSPAVESREVEYGSDVTVNLEIRQNSIQSCREKFSALLSRDVGFES